MKLFRVHLDDFLDASRTGGFECGMEGILVVQGASNVHVSACRMEIDLFD